MSNTEKQQTSSVNGRLWGARSRDWSEVQEPLSKPAYEAVFDQVRLAAGQAYCDVGCGAGTAARLASQRGARVAAVDAADALLAMARERVPQGDFRQADVEQLPFGDHSFDLLTGFNSFQYAGNPAQALREARRVTRPQGHVVIMTWAPPQGMQAASLVAALKPLLPAPPPGAPGPFALSEEAALKALAQSAGLSPIEVSDVECLWEYPDLPTALRGLGGSGVAVRAAEHSGQDAVDRAHAEALAPFRRGDGSYAVLAAFRWLLARP